MSNRRRITRKPQSYAVRVQRRSPAGAVARRPDTGWLRPVAAWLPVSVAVAAEAGHLVAAYLEWPGSAARGTYHVAAGALLGLIAAVVSTASRRILLAAGAAIAFTGPVLWLGGVVLAGSPYDRLAVPVAAAIAVCETALAALLVRTWLAGRRRASGSRSAPPVARAAGSRVGTKGRAA